MAQGSGRLTCPRCGANNFETVALCWKCGAALNTAASVGIGAPPVSGGYPGAERAAASPVYPLAPLSASGTGDTGVATRAAIALALTFPWIGLPVGWVFMMIEDRRKQAIGRICAIWSMVALVFHFLLMFVFMQAIASNILKLVLSGAARGGGGSGINIPNIPDGSQIPGGATP